MAEVIFITIGLLIILYAIISFAYRIIKGEPFWPNFKEMIRLAFEGFWGIG
jgi:hypothetical protein